MPTLPIVIAAIILIIGMLGRVTRGELPLQTKTPSPMPPPAGLPSGTRPTGGSTQTTASRTSDEISSLIYPNSVIKSQGDAPDGTSQSDVALELESTDNAQTITDWYKARIKYRGMHTTSFVQTKTNDAVASVLVGANKDNELRVTIAQNAVNETVRIDVSIQTY